MGMPHSGSSEDDFNPVQGLRKSTSKIVAPSQASSNQSVVSATFPKNRLSLSRGKGLLCQSSSRLDTSSDLFDEITETVPHIQTGQINCPIAVVKEEIPVLAPENLIESELQQPYHSGEPINNSEPVPATKVYEGNFTSSDSSSDSEWFPLTQKYNTVQHPNEVSNISFPTSPLMSPKTFPSSNSPIQFPKEYSFTHIPTSFSEFLSTNNERAQTSSDSTVITSLKLPSGGELSSDEAEAGPSAAKKARTEEMACLTASQTEKTILRKSDLESGSSPKTTNPHLLPVQRCPTCFAPADAVDGPLDDHAWYCQPNPSSKERCPNGAECASRSRAHYRAYYHEPITKHHEVELPVSSESSVVLSFASTGQPTAEVVKLAPIGEEGTAPTADEAKSTHLSTQTTEPLILEPDYWPESPGDFQDTMRANLCDEGITLSSAKVSQWLDSGILGQQDCTDVDNNDGPEKSSRKEMITPPNASLVATSHTRPDKQKAITSFFTSVASALDTEKATPSSPSVAVSKVKAKTSIDELTDSCSTRESAPSLWAELMSKMRAPTKKVKSEPLEKSQQEPSDSTRPPAVPKCPFYKRIEGSSFVVDAFSYGTIPNVTAYFLSHFHYDHYRGLGNWFKQPLYCSEVTANLVRLKYRQLANVIRVLHLNQPKVIQDVEVVLVDANHCPGSVMFVFRFPTGRTVLHVGDFRADASMEADAQLSLRPIDTLYLDTTYCDEYYKLPPQKDVLEYVRQLVREYRDRYPKLLVVCGTYTIGKEKVFKTAAEEIRSLIWAPPEKRVVLKSLNDEFISQRLTTEPSQCSVHVLNTSEIKPASLKAHLKKMGSFTHVLALLPTGWEHDDTVADRGLYAIQPKTHNNIFIYGVPYSEHSSYNELERFVRHFQPRKIIPTVGVGSVQKRQDMEAIFNQWRRPKTETIAVKSSGFRGKSVQKRPRGGQTKKF